MAKGKKKITPGEAVAAISCGMDRHRCCGKYGHKIIVIDGEAVGIAERPEIEQLTKAGHAVFEVSGITPTQIREGLSADQWWALAVRVTLAIMRPGLLDD